MSPRQRKIMEALIDSKCGSQVTSAQIVIAGIIRECIKEFCELENREENNVS